MKKLLSFFKKITLRNVVFLTFSLATLLLGSNIWTYGAYALLQPHSGGWAEFWAETVLMLFPFALIGFIDFGLRFLAWLFKTVKKETQNG